MSASRIFRPKYWGYHAVGLILVTIALGLGFWQLQAWQQQREHEARDLTLIEPKPLDDVLGPNDPFLGTALGHPVLLEGTWVPESTLYIENREYDGKEGFWAVTPLAIGEPGASAILVVRGWTPSVEQAPTAPSGPANFVGILQPTEGKVGLPDDDPTDDILPQLRLPDALQHIDQDLYGGYVVVAEETVTGEWPPVDQALNTGTEGLAPVGVDQLPEASRSTGLRNFLYAVEWWVFGLFAGFLWWRWAKDEVERVDLAS